jgi:RNA polymerase sigma factor (sigma-70 family)
MTGLVDEDDAALVSRCRRGEAAAWEALVHRYQRLVYAIVRRTGLDDHAAADVFQTVFARLVAHLPRIADPQRLQAWIVTTAKREVLLALRRGQRTVSMTRDDDAGDETAEFDVADDAPLPEDALADLQQQALVRNALDRMDARCRELLLMLFRDDDEKLPYEEVAQQLGLSVGSIGPTRARCLGKLRGLVDPAPGKM